MNSMIHNRKNRCLIFVLFFITTLYSFPARAGHSRALGELGRVRHNFGIFRKMKIDGEYIFCATSYGLVIYSTGSNSVLSSLPLGNCFDLDILTTVDNKRYMYVTMGDAGVYVLDVTNPQAPFYLSRCAIPSYALYIKVDENYAFITDREQGLMIADITSKERPVVMGRCRMNDCSIENLVCYEKEIAIDAHHAYVADGAHGLQIIDIKDRHNPQIIGSCTTPSFATAVVIDANYAYVADSISGLCIIDIKDRHHPAIIGSCTTHSAPAAVAIDEAYAYVADGEGGLQIIDIQDRHHPQIIGRFGDIPSSAVDIVVMGDYAYVLDRYFGVHVIEISKKQEPALVESFLTGREMLSVSAETNDYAYLANGEGGFLIIDCIDTNGPRVIGGFSIPGFCLDIVTDNDFAYVLMQNDGFYIVDIKDKTNPLLRGSFPGLSYPESVEIVGDYAYIIDGFDGLHIIDIEDKNNPLAAGHCPLPFYAQSLAIKEDTYAYICDNTASFLQVIDITDPHNPAIAGAYEIESSVNASMEALVISGDRLYMGKGLDGLEIIDISKSAEPVPLGTFKNSLLDNRYTGDVAINGDYAYLANGYSGLQVLDISDGYQLKAVETMDIFPEYVNALTVQGNYLYVALREGGLIKIEIISSVSPRGNLILVAGGGADAQNTLWPATCTQANHLFHIFTEMGFRPYEIYYQNPLLFQDTDEDGILNQGVVDDHTPTREGLMTAIEEWAADQTYTDGPLLIYLIGHGAEDRFQIMPGEVISAEELKTSIATFRQKAPEREVAVIIEAAECGSFIDDLKGEDITVLCATGRGPCYIKPGPAYKSFSTAFANTLHKNYNPDDLVSSLRSSFRSARSMLQQWREELSLFFDQSPQMIIPGSRIVSLSFSLDGETAVNELLINDNSSDWVTIIGMTDTGAYIRPDTAHFSFYSSDPSILIPPFEPVIDSNGVYWYMIEWNRPGNASLFAYEDAADSENLLAARLSLEYQGLPAADDKVAIIVAGYQGSGDYLWPSTNTIANHSFKILRAMGYAKEAIYYYNPFIPQDLDENNVYDDITGYPRLGIFDMDNDLYGFSRIKETGAKELLLFITDHGIENQFSINPVETLAAENLAQKISDIAPYVEDRIILVYDACYSGSFLDEIAAHLDSDSSLSNKLVSITSAASDERAYYLNTGVVSFSYAFFDHYFLTNSILEAFDYAGGFLPYKGQTPHMSNASLAEQWESEDIYYINESRPAIEDIEASRINGKLSVSARVYSLNGIDDVWILVEDGMKEDAAYPGKAITEAALEKMDTYEGGYHLETEDPCPARDEYFIRVYAQDKNRQVTAISYTIPLVKESAVPDDRVMNRTVALIFATDASLFGEAESQKADTQLYRAESILKAKGIDDEEIIRIKSLDILDTCDIVNAQEDDTTLFLYLFGMASNEGSTTRFILDAHTSFTPDELVQKISSCAHHRVLVLVDAPFATHFLSEIPWDDHEGWAGIAGTNQAHLVSPYFSQFFFFGIVHGASVAQAFRVAANAVSINQQTADLFFPGMEETPATWQMIDQYFSYHLGERALVGEDYSLFSSCEAYMDNDDTLSFLLEASSEADIIRAWVILKLFDTYPQQSMIVDLAPFDDVSFKASYTTAMPYYGAVFMAEGFDANMPAFQWEEVSIRQKDFDIVAINEDRFEPDDDASSEIGHTMLINQPPCKRTFYCPDDNQGCQDIDWASFSAEEGHIYEIYAQDLSGYDYFIRLSLYGPNDLVNEQRVGYNYIAFECESAGDYYCRIEFASGAPDGAVEYICGISDPFGGIGSICGHCVNTNGQKLGGYTVRVQNPQKSAITDDEGHFCIKNIPFGNYILKIFNRYDEPVLEEAGVEVMPSFTRREIKFIIDEALPPHDYRYTTCTIPFSRGMNMSLLPAYPEGVFSPYMVGAHLFLQLYLPQGAAIGKYDPSSNRWLMAKYEEDGRIGGDNFSIDPDEGYFLYNSDDSHFICLNIYEPVHEGPAHSEPREGMHITGYRSDKKTSMEVLNSLPDAVSIVTYDNMREGKWQATYQFFGKPAGVDSPIEPYEGYFLCK